jgi:hypothetical protein
VHEVGSCTKWWGMVVRIDSGIDKNRYLAILVSIRIDTAYQVFSPSLLPGLPNITGKLGDAGPCKPGGSHCRLMGQNI